MTLTHQPEFKPEFMILIETMVVRKSINKRTRDYFISAAVNRRDIWSSREEAYKLFKARPFWKAWDERALRIYVVTSSF